MQFTNDILAMLSPEGEKVSLGKVLIDIVEVHRHIKQNTNLLVFMFYYKIVGSCIT